MVALAAFLDVVFLVVAFGARTLIQRRRTGDAGWRLGRPHSAIEALARGLLFGSGAALAVALVRTEARPATSLAIVAAGIAVAAIALVTAAQLQMGASWRIGVDPDEHTTLVRSGLYTRVRNPIYTGMAAFAVAHAVLTPSLWALGGAAAMIIGVEMQVRGVEEPYLQRIHGDAFHAWANESGRFLPHLG